MAAAAITSTSSISNVNSSNTTPSTSILALSSTSRTSPSSGSSEGISSGSLSSPAVVSSSSSRSRRSKVSHYNHGSVVGGSNISSTTTFATVESKSMLPSSNVSSSSKSSHHTAGGSSETSSKSKSSQRRWKEDNNCKSKGLKWKGNLDHVGNSEEVLERGAFKAAKWRATDKSKIFNANLYKMRGLKWKTFKDHIFESDDELRHINEEDDETVLRLDQSDMGLYGLCPETDPFYAVICDICNAVVKPQGLQKHLVHRHHNSHNHKHNSQHAVNNHRNIFTGYSTVSPSVHLERPCVDHGTVTSQSSANLSVASAYVSTGEKHEKTPTPCKPASREISPARNHTSNQQGSSRSSGGDGAHFSSSSSSSKSKSKSTSKVKSKTGKSGKSKSAGNSSNHSSTAPSPSSSSSSSYTSSTNRNGTSSTTAANATSNGTTAPTLTVSHLAGTSAANTTSNASIASTASNTSIASTASSSSFLLNKSSTVLTTAANQTQSCQKNLRATGCAASNLSNSSNQTHSNTHLLQSSSSKSCSSILSKHSSNANETVTSATHCNAPVSPHSNTTTSPNINSTVTSSVAAKITPSACIASVTPRRTYGRCKSSSVERKTVPVKEREYDANKHCGVISGESSRPCTRSLTCKAHSLSMRRMVSGRSKSFDKLLADHRAIKEQPPLPTKSRTMPELESSNSSSSMDLDRRSVSSNSNLSVEVQASSTASSQSSAASAVESASCSQKQSTPPPLTSSAVNRSNATVPLTNTESSSSNREPVGLANNRLDESAEPPIMETVETVCMGNNDNTIQININREGATQSIPSAVNRRGNGNTSQQSRGSNSEEPHRARITTRVIDTSRANVPPELLDDSKFATNIFSPESTVLTGPIRLLAEDENGGNASKRLRIDAEPEPDISNLSEEKKLQLMVQRKVNKKNKVLFRDPNRPSPSAITIPPAAEIVAQAFAEENPSATLTDAQFVMDPETNVVSVSVCGTFNPDNMQLNWAPFNQDFVNNTLSQALSPYGITVPPVTPAQPEQPVYGNPNLMPNPEEEGFQIHHLPPLTEEEYNQMRPEFINGMPKPSMLGCPGIKAEIKQEIDDDVSKASLHRQPILPLIKQEGLKDGIKIEIKQEPIEDEVLEEFETPTNTLHSSHMTLIQELKSDISQMSTTVESTTDTSAVSEATVPDWAASLNNFNTSTLSEVLTEKNNQSPTLMSLDVDDSTDDSCIECLQPIASSTARGSTDSGLTAHGKENSNSENDDRSSRYHYQGNFSSDDSNYRTGCNNFYYGRLPKPNHVNTFGLVKLRGSTNFKKSILCTRRANSSIHAYQTLFQGGHSTFFRRDNTNSLGSKHCTVDCNGAISLNGSGTFEAAKSQISNTPGGGSRNNSAPVGNPTKVTKQARRQNSGNSPNSLLLKRQSSNFVLASASTQTPPSSPFYKRHNSISGGNKVRLQKRSIIMHFRGNGSSQQHLSKTCAILQSQIVHKLAEQLLGFKKSGIQRSEQNNLSANNVKAGLGKQPLQHNYSSGINNCKLSSSCSLVPSLMYQSTSIESGSLQSGLTSSLPTLSSALSSPSAQRNSNNPLKISRTSATVASCSNNSSQAKVTVNASPSRIANNQISQRFPPATPVAIVTPLIAQTHSASSANPLVQSSSTSGLATGKNGNNHPVRARNSMYRQNSMLASSASTPLLGLNGIGAIKTNSSSNKSAVN